MKVGDANLVGLKRIEEMTRTVDMKLDGTAPPAARLWSLLSSTLSAFLSLSQEPLIYVAEDGGKVVGYVQASGQQRGLDLSVAKVMQVLNLQVADSSDTAEVAPALVAHLWNVARARGAQRFVVPTPASNPLRPQFRIRA